MHSIDKCERIEIPQGALYLGPSNKKQSVGYLELKPHTSLTLHNRPAKEKLTQIKGSCIMVIYWAKPRKMITLEKGNTLLIEPARTWHIHSNPFDRISLTHWDFDGDITKIIKEIRKLKN